jgi:hypothetical protein
MANYVKAHGLTIAANGYVQNLVVESFTNATEPVSPPDAGRIWFNTTAKVFKITELDGGGAVIKRTIATLEELQAYINSVAAQTSNASGASLVGYDGQTGTNAQFSLSAAAVDASLDSIVIKIDDLAQDLADLGSGSITDLQNEVNALEAALGGMIDGTDGTYVAFTASNYMNSATSATGALTALDTQLNTTQAELDALETSMGAMVDANGDYVAFTTSNYMDAETDVAAAMLALDTQLAATDAVAQAALPLAGGTMSGNINMGGTNQVTNMAAPTNGTDAANKAYVDAMAQGLMPKTAVKAATTGPITLTGAKTIDGISCVAGDRVLVKDQAAAAAAEVSTVSFAGATPAGLGGKYLTLNSPSTAYYVWFDLDDGSSDPAPGGTGIPVDIATGDTDAQIAGKAQVVLEAHAAFGAIVGTTTVTVTNAVTGVATDIAAGDSGLTVGVVTQGAAATTGETNGIYVVATGAWSRATDADGTPVGEVTKGMYAYVEQGSTQEATGWVLTTDNPITVGTTALVFAQFSSAGLVDAGVGLSKTGNVLEVLLGAGIKQLPTNEVGVDVATNAGLFLTVDGTNPSTLTNARLKILLDGTSLALGVNGLSVNAAVATQPIQDELDDLEAALGAMIDTDGTYVAFTTSNYMDSATSVAQAMLYLDSQAKSCQDEVNAIETTLGAMIDADGEYVAFTTSNYMDAATTVAGAMVALDTQAKSCQDEVNAIETTLGAMIDADGEYVAFTTSNYMNAATTVAGAMLALDSQLKATQDEVNDFETALGSMIDANGDYVAFTTSNYMNAATTVTGALSALDTALQTLDSNINGNTYKQTTSTPATSFTITHSLASQDISVDVWVFDSTDSKYKNDLVGITIVDNNNVQIDLTESRNIKVLVEKFATV